jgi:non-heme chloroperoxidase
MRTIKTPDGIRIAFDDIGDGPPVVLTHGWVVGHEMWEYAAARMADAGMRAITLDRRGCGLSDQPSRGYDFDTLADDLASVVKALDLRDATLVAHSVGGAEAVRALARHGAERIARLVLVATTTPGPPAGTEPDEAALEVAFGGLSVDRPAYIRAGVPGFFGGPEAVSVEMADWAVGLTLRASSQASIGLMKSMATTDTSADVATCPVPTLVIHGDQDVSAPLETTGRITADLLPDSKLLVYEDAPHGLPLTNPGQIAADVLDFARDQI